MSAVHFRLTYNLGCTQTRGHSETVTPMGMLSAGSIRGTEGDVGSGSCRWSLGFACTELRRLCRPRNYRGSGK